MASLPGWFDAVWPAAPNGWLHTYASGTTTPKQAWKDNAETQTHALPTPGLPASGIRLDANGRVPDGFRVRGSYTLHVYTSAGVLVTDGDQIEGQSEAVDSLRIDLSDESSANKNAGLVDFVPSLNYAAKTIGASLKDSRVSLIWFITTDVERAAIKAGTSTTDHTSTISGAMALVGDGELHFGDAGWVWNISGPLSMAIGATYSGKAKVRALSGAGIATRMFHGGGVSDVTLDGLEIDANTDANGCTGYAVEFSSGTRNRVMRCYIHDTTAAGIRAESEDGIVIYDNRLDNCGRVASTDNHGIMIGTNGATSCKNWLVESNTVVNAYRKGIATYGFSTGKVKDGRIVGNTVVGCGLGGIYVAGNIGSTTQATNISVGDNVLVDNYVNLELANAEQLSVGNNTSTYTATAGKYAGISISGCVDISIVGGVNSNAPVHAVVISASGAVASSRITISGMQIRNPNQTTAGTGCGVQLTDATACSIVVDVSDNTGKMTHGVLEGSGCSDNDIGGVIGAGTSARVTLTGANTRLISRDGRNTGFGVAQPTNTVDIDGGLTIREQAIALVNGANQNVSLPAKSGVLVSSAPSAIYSIGGIAGGAAGRRLTLFNYTNFVMTLNHSDSGSAAGNRFILSGATNMPIQAFGGVELVYSAITGGWMAAK